MLSEKNPQHRSNREIAQIEGETNCDWAENPQHNNCLNKKTVDRIALWDQSTELMFQFVAATEAKIEKIPDLQRLERETG